MRDLPPIFAKVRFRLPKPDIPAVLFRFSKAHILLEQNDEWQLQHRYMQIEGMAELDAPAEAHPSLIAEADAAA